jgi:hypothetical protein
MDHRYLKWIIGTYNGTTYVGTWSGTTYVGTWNGTIYVGTWNVVARDASRAPFEVASVWKKTCVIADASLASPEMRHARLSNRFSVKKRPLLRNSKTRRGIKIKIYLLFRVTRLGEFLPFGWLFTYTVQFFENFKRSSTCGLIFSSVKAMH